MGHGDNKATGVLVVYQLVAGSCLTTKAVLQDAELQLQEPEV